MQKARPVSDYIQDLRQWTDQVLSVPSEELDGQAPCPYAAGAWTSGQVAVGLCPTLDDVDDVLDFFPDSGRDIYICILPDTSAFSSEELRTYIDGKNQVLAPEDMWLMEYHPDDDPSGYGLDFLDVEWEPVVPEEYCMVFIQRLSKLAAASYNLESKGYYDRCPWGTYRDLVHRRNQKAIKHGKFRPDDI